MEVLAHIFLISLGIVIGIAIGIFMFMEFVMLNDKQKIHSPLTRLGICILTAALAIFGFSIFLSWIVILTSCFTTVIVIFSLLYFGVGQPRPSDPEPEDRDFY